MNVHDTMAMLSKNHGVSTVLTTNTESASTTSEGTTTVATIILVVSAILGDRTDLEVEEYVTLFHTPHIFWDCLLDGPGFSSCVWIVWVPSLVIIPNDVLHHPLLQSQLSAAFVVQVSDHF